MRLGLSATPEREIDPVGTEAVLNYFGGVCFEYSLKQAMADCYLSPYNYKVILVELTDAETEKYLDSSSEGTVPKKVIFFESLIASETLPAHIPCPPKSK